jgi:hypothetical protein
MCSYDEFHQMMESSGHDSSALTPQAGKHTNVDG